MCELFGMSSAFLAALTFSLEEFASHGGRKGPHRDGWGIAYHHGHDVRLLKDTEPAATSDWIPFVAQHRIRSALVSAHIRRASVGRISFENTQPFVRELGGRVHVFAHNGLVPGAEEVRLREQPRFRPVGETDSERAFCVLLGRLEPLWLRDEPPSLQDRVAILAAFAAEMRGMGPFNFVYDDAELLFLHGHRRRHGDDDPPRPPGLYVLERRCRVEQPTVGGGGVEVTSDPAERQMILAASVPLTDEAWKPLDEGALVVARAGRIVARILPDGDATFPA